MGFGSEYNSDDQQGDLYPEIYIRNTRTPVTLMNTWIEARQWNKDVILIDNAVRASIKDNYIAKATASNGNTNDVSAIRIKASSVGCTATGNFIKYGGVQGEFPYQRIVVEKNSKLTHISNNISQQGSEYFETTVEYGK